MTESYNQYDTPSHSHEETSDDISDLVFDSKQNGCKIKDGPWEFGNQQIPSATTNCNNDIIKTESTYDINQQLLDALTKVKKRKSMNVQQKRSQNVARDSKRQVKVSRKTTQQLQALEKFYRQNTPEWTHEVVQQLSDSTGLSLSQVYKWGWDQRKKVATQPLSNKNESLLQEKENQILTKNNTDEWGGYSKPFWTSDAPQQKFAKKADILLDEDESLCKLVGIDLDKKVKEILNKDTKVIDGIASAKISNPQQKYDENSQPSLESRFSQQVPTYQCSAYSLLCNEEILPQLIEEDFDEICISYTKRMRTYYLVRRSNFINDLQSQQIDQYTTPFTPSGEYSQSNQNSAVSKLSSTFSQFIVVDEFIKVAAHNNDIAEPDVVMASTQPLTTQINLRFSNL